MASNGVCQVKVGYSRISDAQQQATTDPLGSAEHELRKAGAEKVLLDIGSGRDDSARPQFRKLRELVLDNRVSTLICPNQDRLFRNTEELLKFVQLCAMQKVQIQDLNGRELEIKTADGKLMTTVISALDTHRSDLYSEKVRRHLKAAREQGFPARSKVPFGLMKVRNEAGRVVSLGIDPVTGPMARERIDWFLKENLSQTALFHRIRERHPDHTVSDRQVRRWLSSPLLTGRLAWKQDAVKSVLTEVASEQSFPALITDAESEAVKVKLAGARTNSGLRGRPVRMLSGLVKCSSCGKGMTHKCYPGTPRAYLRCSNPLCEKRSKSISLDQVFGVLQYALSEHAKTLLPALQRPKIDPPEVFVLQAQIETLKTVPGTDEVVEAKQLEINRLRETDHSTPGWLLIGAMRSLNFWLQEESKLNQILRLLLVSVTVELHESVKKAEVVEVRCRTVPAKAPLPPDQRNIRLKRDLPDLLLAMSCQEQIEAALKAIG